MNSENKPPKIESNTPSKVYNDDEIELLRKINDNLDKIKRVNLGILCGMALIVFHIVRLMKLF